MFLSLDTYAVPSLRDSISDTYEILFSYALIRREISGVGGRRSWAGMLWGMSKKKEDLVSYQDGALLTVVPMELHHGLEGEITDHVAVEDEERVCSLREQVTGQCQGPSWGKGADNRLAGDLSP